jgi:addiction module RelB/DinJ family antitoxin
MMAKTTTVRALMEPDKKEEVSKILKRLGMNHSEAINIFYSLIKEYEGLPFDLRVPDPRPEIMKHLDSSMKKNRRLGELLKDEWILYRMR